MSMMHHCASPALHKAPQSTFLATLFHFLNDCILFSFFLQYIASQVGALHAHYMHALHQAFEGGKREIESYSEQTLEFVPPLDLLNGKRPIIFMLHALLLLSFCFYSHHGAVNRLTAGLAFLERQFKEKWATLKHAPVVPTKPKPKPPRFMPIEGIWLFILLSIMYWSVVITAYHNIPVEE
jgi:hypothetical protein